MKREDVYKLVDGERDYQSNRHERLIATKPHRDEDHGVADWVIYIEKQLNEAKDKIYFLDTAGALENIRKITALGVACMEYNNTPPR